MSDLSKLSNEELLRLYKPAPRRGESPVAKSLDTVSDDQLLKMWKPNAAQDIAASVPSALGRVPFVIAGAPADALGLGMEAGRWFDEHVLGNPVKSREEVAAGNPLAGMTSDALERAYGDVTGVPMYEPQTGPGKVVSNTVTGAGGGALFGPAGAVMGAAGGAGGEVARQATEGTAWELPASIVGTIGGSAVGGVGLAGARRLVTPRNIPRENANAARVLRREGVRNLTEGQITQRKKLLAAERGRMGIRGDAATIEQFEDLTQAALSRAGINARRATPEVMNQAFDDIGQQFREYSARNTLLPDRDFATDLRGALDYYAGRVAEPHRAPLIGNYVREMQNAMVQNSGRIPGETYQSLRSRIQADARSMADPDAQHTLRALADSLDNAMERSIQRNNPADVGGFREARRLYRNILVIEDAVKRSSSEANLGLITGAALEGATKRKHGGRNWVRGQGDFAELARAAGALMRELPLTGAAPFNTATSLFSAAKTGAGMLRMTRPMQRFLTNRLLPPPGRGPIQRSLPPAIPGLLQQAPNYSPVVDALSQGQDAPATPMDPRTEEIVRALMQ